LPQLSARSYWADGRASVGATDDDDVIQLRHTRQASYGSRAASAISPLSGTQGQYLRQETAKTPRITLDSTLPPSYFVAIIFPLSVQSTIRPTFLQMTDHRGEGILASPSAVSGQTNNHVDCETLPLLTEMKTRHLRQCAACMSA
jgi:hypothetical protein